MDNRLEKLEELNKLNKTGQVTDVEYKMLLSEILDSKTEVDSDNKGIINQVKEAGRNVIAIYYLIIFEIILDQVHDLLLDVKIKYYYKSLGNLYPAQDINFLTKSILEKDNIEKIIEDLKYLNEIYYLIQFVVFIVFMSCLWNIGENLKKVK